MIPTLLGRTFYKLGKCACILDVSLAKLDISVATYFLAQFVLEAKITKLIIIFISFLTWRCSHIQNNYILQNCMSFVERVVGDRYHRKIRRKKGNRKSVKKLSNKFSDYLMWNYQRINIQAILQLFACCAHANSPILEMKLQQMDWFRMPGLTRNPSNIFGFHTRITSEPRIVLPVHIMLSLPMETGIDTKRHQMELNQYLRVSLSFYQLYYYCHITLFFWTILIL